MDSVKTTSDKPLKSGFVSLIGNANTGKSTLLNTILGEKLTITSSKPQTTRNTIRGIYNDDDAQIIFIDTPGLHKAAHKLGDFMTKSALRTLSSVDLILYLVDATNDKDMLDERVIESLKTLKTKTFLIVNKIDKVKDASRLESYIEKLKTRYDFEGVFAVSALNGIHTDLLKEDIKDALPEGPRYYPKHMRTDQPEKFLIAERIREKILDLTQQEIPHSVAVDIEKIEVDQDNKNLLNINATIIVERDSQKGIIIGKNGKLLKLIGTKARHDILTLLDTKIYLDLYVKVVKDWRNKKLHLHDLGFKEDDL